MIEPSTQVALFSFLSLVVTTLGAFGVAWIALQHAKLQRVVQTLEKNTNSMKDALVASVAKASKSEGVLQEQQDEKVRKAEIVIAIGQTEPVVAVPLQPVATAKLAMAIEAVPEKTATKVVEKLADK